MPGADLAYAIGLPPKEAVAYFESKGYAFSFDWREVWQEAHARAFTVAGVTKLDVLKDIRAAVSEALGKGRTLAQFRQDLEPILRRKGWMGRGQVVDQATGEVGKQLAPYRLETIYRTNMQTAYMAGRWKQFKANADIRPYWRYVAVMDARTRPEHAALNGLVFHHDDPFWSSYWPPNGWRCRCRVSALDSDELQAEDLEPEDSAGRLSEVSVPSGREPNAPRVAVSRFEVSPGTFISPDPGWSYNPGQAAWPELQDLATRKMAEAPRDLSAALAREQAGGPGFARFYAKPEGNWPIGVLSREDAALIRAKSNVVLLSAESVDKQKRNHKDMGAADYVLVQDAIDRGKRIQQSALKLAYVLDEPKGGVVVVKATRNGVEVYLVSSWKFGGDEKSRKRELERLLRKVPK